MIHNGSVVYTVRLDESTQDTLERQVVNLWDGAREREDHDKAPEFVAMKAGCPSAAPPLPSI